MIIIYRNRGILVPVYLVVPFIGVTLINAYLNSKLEEFLGISYDYQIVVGVGLLISAIWIYFNSEDKIEINGEEERIEMNNHFFFIDLKTWSYITLVAGILMMLGGFIETLD